MQTQALVPLALLGLVATLASACRFGEASFESTLEGRRFDPSGTVFSYEDERDQDLDIDDNPRVVVVMVWPIFDPASDLNDLAGVDLANLAHELWLRDGLALVFHRSSDVAVDATFTTTGLDGEPGAGGMAAQLHLAPEALDADSTYADIVPLASSRTATVTITDETLGRDGALVAGEVALRFERQDSDPGDAIEGELRGTFSAPVVAERIAERNLAILDVQRSLGLPLPPRATGEAP